MLSIDSAMLMIKGLDRNAHLEFSDVTGKWYVSARLEICGNGVLCGITEHRATPQQAVEAFLERLQTVEYPLRICANAYTKNHREWRWNGAAFAET